MKIAVVGGGIGGLAATLHLLKAGFDVHVYEQSPRIGEIGAGIQISPNASRLLVRLRPQPGTGRVGARAAGRSRSRAPPATPPPAATPRSSWAPPCRPNACMSATGWSAWSRRAS